MNLCESGGAFAVDMGVPVSTTTFTFLTDSSLRQPRWRTTIHLSRNDCITCEVQPHIRMGRIFSILHMPSRLQQATSHRRRPAISVSVSDFHQHVRSRLIALASSNGAAHWTCLERSDDCTKDQHVSFHFSEPVERAEFHEIHVNVDSVVSKNLAE